MSASIGSIYLYFTFHLTAWRSNLGESNIRHAHLRPGGGPAGGDLDVVGGAGGRRVRGQHARQPPGRPRPAAPARTAQAHLPGPGDHTGGWRLGLLMIRRFSN